MHQHSSLAAVCIHVIAIHDTYIHAVSDTYMILVHTHLILGYMVQHRQIQCSPIAVCQVYLAFCLVHGVRPLTECCKLFDSTSIRDVNFAAIGTALHYKQTSGQEGKATTQSSTCSTWLLCLFTSCHHDLYIHTWRYCELYPALTQSVISRK